MEKLALFVFVLFCMFLHESLSLSRAAKSVQSETNPSQSHSSKNLSSVNPLSKDAYVTLLYDGFLLGVRVLGQSLRDTGTNKDLVVVCTETVSENDRAILRSDGWIIRSVKTVESPYEGSSSPGDYFKGSYTKLFIWSMTEYERLVYLDADVMVLANIDHLFDCGTFCAAFRHSDLFNTGVLVIEPSTRIYKDMLEKVQKFSSYDLGDQGFLNVYFKDVMYASMFNWSDQTRQKKPMRMSGRLNGDMGMYYAYSRWVLPEKEIKVIHYSLGPVKPWKWWTLTSGLFDLSLIWQDSRKRLPKYAYDKDNYRWWNLLFWGPFPLLIVLFISFKLLSRYLKILCWITSITKVLTFCACSRKLIRRILPLTILLLSYYLSFRTVPETMEPRQAEYVFWLWSNFFMLFFSSIIFQFYHFSKTLDGGFYSRASPGGRKQLFAFCFLYPFSYILLKVIPLFVHSFNKRMATFVFLLAVHLTSAHIAGTRIQNEIVGKAREQDLIHRLIHRKENITRSINKR